MSGFDGNGTYNRFYNWTQDASNSVPITASRFDTEHNGFAAALTNCITRDGQGKPTANIDMNAHRLMGLADAVNTNDAVSLSFLNGGSGLIKIDSTGIKYDQTPAELAAGVTPVNYSIPNHDVCGIAIAERYGNNTTPLTTDMSPALQKAITVGLQAGCDAGYISDCLLASSVNIDRQVDGAAFDAYFTVYGFGKQLYVNTAITMFSSSLTHTTDPVTQLVQFDNVRFVANSGATAAYVLDNKYLRTLFNKCTFSKIKCLASSIYVQSIYFYGCNARRWTGDFFSVQKEAYDIQVIGGLYEAGNGGAFNLLTPIGCKFWTQIEGMTGTALTLPNTQGVDICLYAEGNGLDIDFRTGQTTTSYGINLHGGLFSHANATYSIKWGASEGAVSQGNWHTYNMHDLLSTSHVDINDFAQVNLSNADAAANIGYREGNTGTLVARGALSASYTASAQTSKYTRIGKRLSLEFTLTLTSTGTNAAEQFYIPSTFPYNAAYAGALCGYVEVVGSATNNGISPLYIANATGPTVQSSINVIPSNVATNSWTVRGQISYVVA